MKYNIGDKVVITGKASVLHNSAHSFAVGTVCEVIRPSAFTAGWYWLSGMDSVSGAIAHQIAHYTDFQPAPKDRIPASDGHEGETFYRFNHTEGNSI